ncbi:uncharacterized protein LOC115728179 [Rhodamnia argentea]|uniref:Uncharacterized protein LOC115728179 n=1 Tax=Rhodamnia argentea TaxID=178133 RepID=A0ABM3HUJ3_9MYRT|nr:uncharacterized protein LOC115728179 [Rhodamnia argentea]
MPTERVNLKLLVDKTNRRVLFAEGGKDFVDFLFHILALPVGTVIRLLEKIGMVGSLGNLYSSIEKLNDVINAKTYYRCSSRSSVSCSTYVAEHPSAKCPNCGNSMNQRSTFVESPAGNLTAAVASAAESAGKGGFVQGLVTYMVMDDLVVKPMSTISSITLLNQFNVKEIGHLEEKVVNLGMDEGIKLLRASLHSTNVLTDVFLDEK